MAEPRVLCLIQRFRPVFTGMGVQLERIARDLADRGVRMEILTHAGPEADHHEPDARPAVWRIPLPVTRNPLELWWKCGPARRFLRERRNDFDILHVQGAPPAFPLLLNTVRTMGWKTAISSTLLHSDDPLTIRNRGRMGRWRHGAYREADRFLGLAPAVVDTFPEAGIAADRVDLIPPGVDTGVFKVPADRGGLAKELGWSPDRPRAVFVGAVIHRKGVDVLFEAWRDVLAQVPEAELVVVGPTEFPSSPEFRDFAEGIRQQAGESPFQGSVKFLGSVNDPAELSRILGASHAFLFPSRMEGFGIVIIEALATGLPAVVARIPGITDYNVRDGQTGFVVDQEDPKALANRAVALLTHEGLRTRLGQNARKDVEERFSSSAIAERYRAFYRKLTGNPPG